jgi:hypothetical protein
MRALTVDVLGTAVVIDVPASVYPELRAALRDLEPATGVDRELALVPGDHGFDLREDGRIIRRDVDPRVGTATLVWRLNTIAAESTSHVLLHAACVTAPHGGGVLLVGGPGAGKSTLAAALVRAGMAYLSDELAGIDRAGLLAPYPKPLGLGCERLVPGSTLGTVAASATPAAVVFPRYRPGTGIRAVQLDPAWTFAALAAHANNLAVLRGTALAWLASLALACPAYQLTHDNANRVVATVRQLASAPARPLKPATILEPVTSDTTTVAVGESLAVMHEPSGLVHVLNPRAAAAWRHAVARLSDGSTSRVDAGVDMANNDGKDQPAEVATVDELRRLGLLARRSAS